MRVQALSSGLRVTVSLREARAIRQLVEAGAKALDFAAPDQTDEIVAMLDIGVHDVATRQAEARARRKEKTTRPDYPPMMNIDVEGFTISAELGDWIDISTVPDFCVWGKVTPERQGEQREIRRNTWRVLVLNPDRHSDGVMFLATDCTETDDRADAETVARKLVQQIAMEDA